MLPRDLRISLLLFYKMGSFEIFDFLLEKLRDHIRVTRNQKMELSVGIMDSQSVKWDNNS